MAAAAESMSSTASTSSATYPSSGYPIEIVVGEPNPKFKCSICRNILRNPVQSYCGHRSCKDCIERLSFPDNAIKRELMVMKVKCCNHECIWTGNFKDFEAHYIVCEHLPIPCDVCNEPIQRSKMEAHKAEHIAAKGCPYGCQPQVSAEALPDHMHTKQAEHLEILRQRISAIESSVGSGSQAAAAAPTDPALQAKLADLEQKLQRLIEQFRQAEQAMRAGGEGRGAVGGRPMGGGAAGASGGGGPNLMAEINEKLMVYEGVLTVLNREIEKLSMQAETVERVQRSDRETIDALDRKIKSLERQLAMKDATIAELDLRVSALEQTSYTGTLLWRINDVSRRRQEAISGRTPSIYSPAFYTSKTGYKMCARIYLNGDGMGKNSHVSLFFVVMRGNYDALLKWPFRQKVTLTFLDQNNREHVLDAFRPDPTSSSFKRPVTEMNIASGCPLLLPLATLDNPAHAYIKDNTAFIKIIVSVDDLD